MQRYSLLTAADLLCAVVLLIALWRHLATARLEQFGGTEPNPSFETCERAVAFIKEHRVDFVLAVGGGSVVDATKLIVMGATYDGPVIDVMRAGAPGGSSRDGTKSITIWYSYDTSCDWF